MTSSTTATPEQATTSSSTDILDLQAELQRDLANMAQTLVAPTGQAIKITAGRWQLPNGKTSIEPLNVIILGWRWINRYYPGVYDPNKIESPACWAVSEIPSTLEPQGGEDMQHTDCASCPMNKFGTGANGSGKACRNGARIAMVASDLKSDIVYLDIAPTSIKSFTEAMAKLESTSTHPLTAIVTVDIDTKVSYAKAIFTVAGLNGQDLAQVFALRKEAAAVLDAITFDYNG